MKKERTRGAHRAGRQNGAAQSTKQQSRIYIYRPPSSCYCDDHVIRPNNKGERAIACARNR